MNNSVIRCENISKIYGEGELRVDVLSEVNLSVNAQEMIAILGNSGSGKSTLLHLLGGLDSPTSGRVLLLNQEINQLSELEKCQLRNQTLGFIYQFHHLLPEFTALENVGMPLLIRGLDPKLIQEKAEHWLEMVGLKNRMQHKMSELSGGERQRVAIARALVIDPACILADEPTGNLDPRNAEKVFELFLSLQAATKSSVVIVTHDLQIAKRAQKTYLIDHGCLKEM